MVCPECGRGTISQPVLDSEGYIKGYREVCTSNFLAVGPICDWKGETS